MSYFSKLKERKPLPKRTLKAYDLGKVGKLIWMFRHPDYVRADIGYGIGTMNEEDVTTCIEYALEYMGRREDCSDFAALQLISLLNSVSDDFFEKPNFGALKDKIRDAFLAYKFWITDDGEDSVCYYSENHQAIFACAELLTSEHFAGELFDDGMTAEEHSERSKTRFNTWCEQRLGYGFSEFYSAAYLPIDMAALGTYLLYGRDETLKKKCKAVMDILFYDFALQSFEGILGGAQGRAYTYNLTSFEGQGNSSCTSIIKYALAGDRQNGIFKFDNMAALAIYAIEAGAYVVPEEILKVYNTPTTYSRASSGLSLVEMQTKCLTASDEAATMYRLGMGALTNPEVIESSFKMIEKYNLWHNAFLNGFKYLDLEFLKKRKRMQSLASHINLFTHGMAIERHNVYTYRTPKYKMSTLVKYKPGTPGAQINTMGVTIPGVNIYTMHPLNDDNYGIAPGYFGGYGVAPDAVQDENVIMIIHRIPLFIPFAPNRMLPYTHTFLPKERLDVAVCDGHYAFFKKGDVFGAIIGASDLTFKKYDRRISVITYGYYNKPMEYDLIQYGRHQFTIYELSSADKETFADFVTRIKLNKVQFDGKKLTYCTRNREYVNVFNETFTINGEEEPTEFPRYDSVFGYTDRTAKNIKIGEYTIDLE